MKFNCSTSLLSDACSAASRVIAVRSPLPAVQGILIRTEGDSDLTVTGYDLEIGLATSCKADIIEPGAIIVPRVICDILKWMSNGLVSIESGPDNKIVVSGGNSRYDLMGIDASSYPDVPFITSDSPVTVNQKVLRDMIRQTVFAVSTDESQKVHRGVKFTVADNCLTMAALDGYRLAVRRENIEYTGEALSFVVPGKTLNEVSKLLTEDDKTVRLELSGKQIVFDTGDYTVVSRLLDGNFINYEATVPGESSTQVKVSTGELLDGLGGMMFMYNEKSKSPLKCSIGGGEIRMFISTATGSTNVKLNADTDGSDLEIAFNTRYLFESVRAAETEQIKLYLNGSYSPCVIKPVDGDSFLYMVLPVRLNNI